MQQPIILTPEAQDQIKVHREKYANVEAESDKSCSDMVKEVRPMAVEKALMLHL